MPKAYVFTRYGGPETEALVEQDRPSPGPGQVLVAVRAAGVNPVDWKQRTGYARPGAGARELPAVLGNEVAGVVEELGPDVTGFTVGDEVFGNPVVEADTQSTRCCRPRSPPTSPPRSPSRTRRPCPSPRRPRTTGSTSSACPPAPPC